MKDSMLPSSNTTGPAVAISKTPSRFSRPGWRVALAIYCLLTVLLTWPLVLNFTTLVPGVQVEDRFQNLWNMWWVRQALTHFQNPYTTDLLFYPYSSKTPLPLIFQTLQLPNMLLTLPAQLFGLLAAYNTLVFFCFISSGLGAFWLARQLGRSFEVAVVCGAIYTFSPFHFTSVTQSITNIMSQEFIPFFALFLHATARAERDKRLKPGLACALTLAMCAYTDWYITSYLICYALFFGLWCWLDRTRWNWRDLAHRFMTALLVTGIPVALGLALALPLLVPLLLSLNDPRFVLDLGPDSVLRSSASFFSFFIPKKLQNSWNGKFLGYVPLLLAVAGVFFVARKKRPASTAFWEWPVYWLALVLAALVLALGPYFQLDDQPNPVAGGLPLPYQLFNKLPLISISRSPGRFVVIATLGLAMLAGFALERVSERIGRYRLANGLVLGLLVLEVGVWPLPLGTAQPDPFFSIVATEPAPYAVLEIPITRHYNSDHYRMLNQTAYGQPIMGGYLSRPVVDPYCTSATDFKVVCNLRDNNESLTPQLYPLESAGPALDYLLKTANFHFVAVYKDDYRGRDPQELTKTRQLLQTRLGEAALIYENDTLIGYRVPPEILTNDPPVGLYTGRGWFNSEYNRATGKFFRWTRDTASIYATNTRPNQPVTITFEVLNSQGGPRDIEILAGGKSLAKMQVSSNNQPQQFSFQTVLGPGRTEIRFHCLQPSGQLKPSDERKVGIAISSIAVVK